jgi:hypothetical protein
MDIILKPSGGQNVVLRPQARETWYPPAHGEAVEVEVFRRELDADGRFAGAAVSLGRFPSTGKLSIPNNPVTDKNLLFYFISYSADGTPDVSSLEDAVQVGVPFKRETAAPAIGQVGDATAESVTVGVSGYTKFASKRRLKIAESLDGGALVNPTTAESVAVGGQLGDYIDISRTGTFTPVFSFSGGDPAESGFTKVGAAPAEAVGDGWRINSTGLNSATYYTKDDFPAAPFAGGVTLELDAPGVTATEAAGPAECVAVVVENGVHLYELTFDADEVKLNGGTSHAHGDAKVRLVVAAGGLTADLWIGDTLIENNTAGAAAMGESRLAFGDLAGADDADAVWRRIACALSPVPVKLERTIYVTVAHSSGGAYGAESEVLTLTFASEGETLGGSTGDFDPTPRFKVDYEELS